MRFTRLGWLSVFASGILLTGCTAPYKVPTPATSVVEISAEETCAEVMDIGTMVVNLSNAHREGRLRDAEWIGVGHLAQSMAEKVDVEPDTALADAVAALRKYPPRDSGMGDEWAAAFNAFKDPCGQAPLENFGIMGWSGG